MLLTSELQIAFARAMRNSNLIVRWPMKNSIKCPVCGRDFDPRTPVCHISKYHQSAKNCELEKIRDARRRHYAQNESSGSSGLR